MTAYPTTRSEAAGLWHQHTADNLAPLLRAQASHRRAVDRWQLAAIGAYLRDGGTLADHEDAAKAATGYVPAPCMLSHGPTVRCEHCPAEERE